LREKQKCRFHVKAEFELRKLLGGLRDASNRSGLGSIAQLQQLVAGSLIADE
jgi:hypothetical protein